MAYASPAFDDTLDSPSHSKGHRVYDWDTACNDGIIKVGSDDAINLYGSGTGSAFYLPAFTAANKLGQLAASGDTGQYLAGATGAIPAWATLNQAAVAGLTTASSPQFAGIELGHASDTTIARVSAGVASIEGKNIYLAGGTDVAVADGGTNISSYAVGDLLYASGATTLSKLADVAAGSYLRSGGVTTAPVWSTLILPNAGTAYKLAAYTATNTLTELAAVGATGEYLKGNTGAIPSWATLNQAAVAGLTTADSPTFNQGNFTTLHTTTLLSDHIGEHTGAHTVVMDNIVQLANALYFTQTDGAEKIDSDADGDIDYYAGTSHDFIIGSTEQITLTDGKLAPTTDDDIDLGDSTHEFKDAYIDGTAYIDAITLGATAITSTGTQLNYLSAATGTTGTTSTNLVFSTSPTLVTPALGAATYTTLTGGNVIPTTDSTSDLGASTPKYWANAYLDKVLLNSTATLDGTSAGVITGTGAFTTTLDIGMVATKKLYLDGVARTGNTYIFESSADVMDFYAGGANILKMNATTATFVAGAVVNFDHISETTASHTIVLDNTVTAGAGMPDFIVFPVQSAKVGHLGATAAKIDGSLLRWYVNFDPDTDWYADYQFIMPFTYAAQTLTVKLMWTDTVASNNVVWNASLMAMTSGDAALLETDSFDTANATTTAASGTLGRPVTTSITMTNKDSVAAGDICVLRISRDANNASDTNTGVAKLAGLILEWN